MNAPRRILEQYGEEISSHRKWIRSFDPAYGASWDRRLRTDPEAAICEAAARELLEARGIAVEPRELSCGGPDYLCWFADKSFSVEVTCLSRNVVTRVTELSDGLPTDAEDYSYATKKVMDKVRRKTKQCAHWNGPRLLVVGTFHAQGEVCFDDLAAEDLLTGTPGYGGRIDTLTGGLAEEPRDITCLRDSLFVRQSKESGRGFEFSSSSVSAVLLCAFSVRPPVAHGVLHPNPAWPFDRALLADIKFAKLVDGCLENSALEVEWV